MEKIRVAIVGYGNIGKSALEAVEAAPDMVCAGIVRRNPSKEGFPELADYQVVADVDELGKVDVAILCTPSRKVGETAVKYLAKGINTIDSFDIHSSINELRAQLAPVCQEHGAVSVISAGWDQRLGRTRSYAGACPLWNNLHKLRSRPFNGSFRCRKIRGRCEGCPQYDYPFGNRHTQTYGVCGS